MKKTRTKIVDGLGSATQSHCSKPNTQERNSQDERVVPEPRPRSPVPDSGRARCLASTKMQKAEKKIESSSLSRLLADTAPPPVLDPPQRHKRNWLHACDTHLQDCRQGNGCKQDDRVMGWNPSNVKRRKLPRREWEGR